jgi:hypothetical protein
MPYYLIVKEQTAFSCQVSTIISNNDQKLTSDYFLTKNGGGERDRTDDLLRARQALSQLSYTPTL